MSATATRLMAPVGHFTSMQVRDGAVQALHLHLERLQAAQRELFGGAIDEAGLRARVREALAEAGARAGITGAAGVAVGSGAGAVTAAAATVRIVCRAGTPPVVEVEPPREPASMPLRVRSHRGLRSRPQVKHLDLAAQVEARDAARAAGFDDALLVDAAGRIAEGTFWNLAALEGDAIVWPDAPVLEGVTQRRLQAALEGAGIPQRRRVVRLDGLAGLRAAFALNARGLQEIGAIDGHRFPGDAAMADGLRCLLAADPWQPL